MSSALMCAHCYRDHNQTTVVHSKQLGFSPAIMNTVHMCALKLQVEAAAGLSSGLSCSFMCGKTFGLWECPYHFPLKFYLWQFSNQTEELIFFIQYSIHKIISTEMGVLTELFPSVWPTTCIDLATSCRLRWNNAVEAKCVSNPSCVLYFKILVHLLL